MKVTNFCVCVRRREGADQQLSYQTESIASHSRRTHYSLLLSNNKTKARCCMYQILLLLLCVICWFQVCRLSVSSG